MDSNYLSIDERFVQKVLKKLVFKNIIQNDGLTKKFIVLILNKLIILTAYLDDRPHKVVGIIRTYTKRK